MEFPGVQRHVEPPGDGVEDRHVEQSLPGVVCLEGPAPVNHVGGDRAENEADEAGTGRCESEQELGESSNAPVNNGGDDAGDDEAVALGFHIHEQIAYPASRFR